MAVVALLAAVLVACSPGTVQRRAGTSPQTENSFALTSADTQALSRFDAAYTKYSDNPGNTRLRKQFRDVYARVRAEYVRPVDQNALIDAAVAGMEEYEAKSNDRSSQQVVEAALDAMTASLDPHSTYLNPDELRDVEVATTGRFGGLGIRVAREEGAIRIISPIEGTPADHAGLEPGDLITHVNGRAVADMTLMQAVNTMRGTPGTDIQLRIARNGHAPFDVTITRAVINIKPVRWDTFGNIGYVRIVSFNERTDSALDNAMEQIHDKLGHKPAGLVLDLRNNPGGIFVQSMRVADAFLDEGVIVSVSGRDGRGRRNHRATRGDVAESVPMVVLINNGSASASEIVASALKGQHRAVVMGRSSFGKGSVQTIIRLPEEGALKLTTALYYGPSGHTIQGRGVVPDVELSRPAGQAVPKRERDLPRALPPEDSAGAPLPPVVDVATCPETGKNKDREIGCAVELLHAGSLQSFLSRTKAAAVAK